MVFLRGIIAGIFVWSCVSLSFYILEKIPLFKDSFSAQALIVMICISLYAFLSAQFYYKKGYKTNGLIVGIIISGTAILLDVLITVPFVEIPNGRSYQSFFSSPVLWIMVLITVFTVYFYWKKKIKSN
jgi:RsiW-degrading membrane proteinase PrsW (M82 family)